MQCIQAQSTRSGMDYTRRIPLRCMQIAARHLAEHQDAVPFFTRKPT